MLTRFFVKVFIAACLCLVSTFASGEDPSLIEKDPLPHDSRQESIPKPHNPDMPTAPKGKTSLCVDRCGDGNCDMMVCMGEGCPCSEDHARCPQDCPA